LQRPPARSVETARQPIETSGFALGRSPRRRNIASACSFELGDDTIGDDNLRSGRKSPNQPISHQSSFPPDQVRRQEVKRIGRAGSVGKVTGTLVSRPNVLNTSWAMPT
jgi:hypothetical protein